MTKKKLLKITALITAVILICGLCVFANMLVGNPVSKLLALRSAKKYLETHYLDTPYFVDEVNYSFKDGRYYARISSPDSMDNYFNIGYNSFGRQQYCDYVTLVTNRQNTVYRLINEYRDSIVPILKIAVKDGDVNGILNFDYDSEHNTGCLRASELELDGVYDVMELGKVAGNIYVYVDSDDATPQAAAKYLMDIKKTVDESGGKFYKINFSIRSDDSTSQRLYLFDFPYCEIYEDGLAERVKKAIDESNSGEKYKE